MERIKTHRPDIIKKYFAGVSVEDIASEYGFTPQGIYKDMHVYSEIWHLRLDRLERQEITAGTKDYKYYHNHIEGYEDEVLPPAADVQLSHTACAARALERLLAVMHFREKRLIAGVPVPQS